MAHPPTEWGRKVAAAGRRVGAVLALACCALPGCRTPDWSMSKVKELWDPLAGDYASIDGSAGPLQRVLNWNVHNKQKRDAATPPEALAAYDAAEKLYKAGDYKGAEKAFKAVAKKWPDTPIEEDALFMKAEAQYEQKTYAWAQDSYAELFKKYPGTRYMNQTTQRLFRIAQIWLRFPEMVQTAEVQPVNMEKPKATPTPGDNRPTSYDPSRIIPIFPNIWDRSRPVFDTDGRALEALKAIWLNDPTGALADDALMLTASHHLRRGDYMEADRIYTILREQYPKSTHLEDAFVLGTHVRLMSYQGAPYDGTALKSSRELAESTLRLYPEHPERERLLAQIRRTDEELAAREWEALQFWLKKGRIKSAAVYAHEVIRLYPNSTYAAQARALLQKWEGEQQAAAENRGSLIPPRLLPFGLGGDDDAKPLPPASTDEPPGHATLPDGSP